MMRIVLLVGGVIVTLAGILFFLQGLGAIGGSAMSGKGLWVVLGLLIAVGGLLLVRQGRRTPSDA